MRKITNIKWLQYLNSGKRIALAIGQAIYETPKAYEIWEEDTATPAPTLIRIKRIDKNLIGWVYEK